MGMARAYQEGKSSSLHDNKLVKMTKKHSRGRTYQLDSDRDAMVLAIGEGRRLSYGVVENPDNWEL